MQLLKLTIYHLFLSQKGTSYLIYPQFTLRLRKQVKFFTLVVLKLVARWAVHHRYVELKTIGNVRMRGFIVAMNHP